MKTTECDDIDEYAKSIAISLINKGGVSGTCLLGVSGTDGGRCFRVLEEEEA